ncbi:MAG: hypothetical protein RL141_521 [Candidatus Parcubacteria bacterium]|jgi:hypothetical protein
MFDLTPKEQRILRQLSTPGKVQDFLYRIPYNFEPNGDTCRSPRVVLRERTAHCIEGAMLAALAFRLHGRAPLIVDLEGTPQDCDHVIAVFQEKGKWGAVSSTNHSVLRFRDPVYATIRELVMSYFHEYTDHQGRKTLRAYSRPINLSRFDHIGWMTRESDVWEVPEYLVEIGHTRILTPTQARSLRRQEPIERKAGEMVQWKPLHGARGRTS